MDNNRLGRGYPFDCPLYPGAEQGHRMDRITATGRGVDIFLSGRKARVPSLQRSAKSNPLCEGMTENTIRVGINSVINGHRLLLDLERGFTQKVA